MEGLIWIIYTGSWLLLLRGVLCLESEREDLEIYRDLRYFSGGSITLGRVKKIGYLT